MGMVYLQWLYSSHEHKTRLGYFLNHDNLMLATPEERRKLIFYFIANQVPEKLRIDHRQQYLDARRGELDSSEDLAELGGTVAFWAYMLKGRLLRHNHFYNLGALLFGGIFVGSFICRSAAHTLAEPEFINNNKVLDQLSQ